MSESNAYEAAVEVRDAIHSLRTSSPLAGKWFLSRKEEYGAVQWQGRVIDAVTPEVYLVQTYEWLGGGPDDLRLVKLADMLPWTFFECDEDMREAHRHAHLRPTSDDSGIDLRDDPPLGA